MVRNYYGKRKMVETRVEVSKPNGAPWRGNPLAGPKSFSIADGRTRTRTTRIRIPASPLPSGRNTIEVAGDTFRSNRLAVESSRIHVIESRTDPGAGRKIFPEY